MDVIHPARTYEFDVLYDKLQEEVFHGRVYEQTGEDGLRLYCYSDACVYERQWNDVNIMARGLILDVDKREVVATPFPKFFNVQEKPDTIPDLPFEVFDKLDGSLIIIFHYGGKWKCATKGSFQSEQAQWAQALLEEVWLQGLEIGTTYLAEAIYPQNRIVVDYGSDECLAFLGAYDKTGHEIPYDKLNQGYWLGRFKLVRRCPYSSISELLASAETLDSNSEGFVLRFSNGHRLKIKGAEYCRLHRMVSRLTPLSIWEAMRDDQNLEDIRRQLPEEFWQDFDTIVELLQLKISALISRLYFWSKPIENLSDKEVGLILDRFPKEIRRFIFPSRRGNLLEGRARRMIYEEIRPDRNILEGYRASSSMARIQENE